MDVDILREKIAFGFDLIDANSDGMLTEQDYVVMGEHAASALGYSNRCDQRFQLIEVYAAIWREVLLPHVTRADRAVTRDEFIRGIAALADDPAAAAASLGALAEKYFDVTDLDRNGVLDQREYEVFLVSHFPDIERRDIEEAFDYLDRNRDGVLSRAEFSRAIVEYWTSADPDALGNWALGTPIYLRRPAFA
jgi:hypothetical protein